PTCAEMVRSLREAGQPAVSDQTPVPTVVNLNRASGNGTSPVARQGQPVLSPSARRNLPSLSVNQKLPPLVNQRAAANAVLANARTAPPEENGPGVLFPALVIGLGQFGL